VQLRIGRRPAIAREAGRARTREPDDGERALTVGRELEDLQADAVAHVEVADVVGGDAAGVEAGSHGGIGAVGDRLDLPLTGRVHVHIADTEAAGSDYEVPRRVDGDGGRSLDLCQLGRAAVRCPR